MIKRFVKIAVTLLLIAAFAHANEHKQESTSVALLVYKTSTYGCCKTRISPIEDEGFIAHSKDYRNIRAVKNNCGIQPNHCSCHTAVTLNGVVFKGHVPNKLIKQFLAEKHNNAIGLAVPAGPVGSPSKPYSALILLADRSGTGYENVNTHEEQC